MATYSSGESTTASPFDALRTGPSRRPSRPPQDERIRKRIYEMLYLAMLCIIARFAGNGHWFGNLGMREVPMIPLPSAIDKSGRFEVSDKFSNLASHRHHRVNDTPRSGAGLP